MIYLWSTKTSVGKVMAEVDVDWYNFFRDVCAQYFIDHPAVIVGQGVEVEIDESKFGKRKFNRGWVVDGHWVFGGIERTTGDCLWNIEILLHFYPLYSNSLDLAALCTVTSGVRTAASMQ